MGQAYMGVSTIPHDAQLAIRCLYQGLVHSSVMPAGLVARISDWGTFLTLAPAVAALRISRTHCSRLCAIDAVEHS